MKAFVLTQYGGPDKLELLNVETPQPKSNEILIKVYATSVNRTDCAMMEAYPFVWRFTMGLIKPKKNTILGTEFAGVVEAIGADVTKYKVNDRVFGFHDQGIGSHCEYFNISENKAIGIIPEKVSFEQAAVSVEGAHYAINFVNKVSINSSSKIMINGASGGIGSAVLQFCSALGAEISVTCRNKDIDLMKSLGASKVIDYTKDDFTKNNETYHYVFDTVGKSTFNKCKPILKAKGIYISSELGAWMQNVWFSLFSPLTSKLPGKNGKRVKFPLPVNIDKTIAELKEQMQSGTFKPVIDRIYNFNEIPEAFEYVKQGLKTGNVGVVVQK